MRPFNIAILCLLVVIALFQTCNYLDKRSDIDQEGAIDTVFVKSKDYYHTLPGKEIPVPYLVEVPGVPGATIAVPSQIDTLAVIRDYYSRRHYADSLKNDSISVYVTESSYMNRVYDRKIQYKWLAPTMVITKTKTVERQLVFLGGSVTGDATRFGLYPSAFFDTDRMMFGVGKDLLSPAWKVGVYGKFKLWKKRR